MPVIAVVTWDVSDFVPAHVPSFNSRIAIWTGIKNSFPFVFQLIRHMKETPHEPQHSR
jgi:hypothetical protein